MLRRMSATKGIDFRQRRRQADKIEIQPPNQSLFAGPRRRFQLLCLQSRQHKAVDRIAGPGLARFTSGTVGRSGATNAQCFSYLAPVRSIAATVLLGSERTLPLSGGGIISSASVDMIRSTSSLFGRFARHNRLRARIQFGLRRIRLIESQAGLASRRIGAMAFETAIGKNRQNVAPIANRVLGDD